MIETAHPLSVASNSIGEGRGNVFLFFFLKKKKKEITIYVPPFSNGPFANKKLYDVTP